MHEGYSPSEYMEDDQKKVTFQGMKGMNEGQNMRNGTRSLEGIELVKVNRLAGSYGVKNMIQAKVCRETDIQDIENVSKLINNPYMEMMDIKCEFH